MSEELKPVRCGCGGEAEVLKFNNKTWIVMCNKCRTSSENYTSRDKAIVAWNRAIGATNLQIVVKKISEFCGNCPKNNSDCNPTDGDYCQDLAKYIIDLQSKMASASQNT